MTPIAERLRDKGGNDFEAHFLGLMNSASPGRVLPATLSRPRESLHLMQKNMSELQKMIVRVRSARQNPFGPSAAFCFDRSRLPCIGA